MALTISERVTDFLNALNDPDVTDPAARASSLMAFFCADGANPNPPPNEFPCLGITDHGPAFLGATHVSNFFLQLFTTFDDMLWISPPPRAPNAQRLTAANVVGIQVDVNGTFAKKWFPLGHPHHSLPLSQLEDDDVGEARALGQHKKHHAGLPAFAIFSFDGDAKIQQLQIYLDRYALMQSTGLEWHPDGPPAAAQGAPTA